MKKVYLYNSIRLFFLLIFFVLENNTETEIVADNRLEPNNKQNITTIKFGCESFERKLSALSALTENQLNVKMNCDDSIDLLDDSYQPRKQSFSGTRPPKKPFQTTPTKSFSQEIFVNQIGTFLII